MKKRDLYYERIPTKLLREDIRLLGTFLGRVIRDQEGLTFYKIVERLRLLSKNTLLDKNKSKVFLKVSKEVKKLKPKDIFRVTRSFSHILNLMNLAESLDASRKLNEYENPYFKNKNQNIFIEDIIKNLFKDRNISNKKIYEQATKLDIGIVLTAHPTEVKRRTLIQKYANLIELMEQRHLYKKYPSKILEIDRKIYTEITVIWKTDELKRSKPSPLDEAKWGLAVIEDSLWDTIPKVYKRLNDIFRKNLGKDLPRGYSPIQFGSWMGGDRDGNPNVTADITKKVILFSRWQAAKLYEKELTKLIQDLSMKECSPKIKKITGNSFEPYRVYLRPIRDKIRLTYQLIEKHLNNNESLN
jgi:phosphoenolpyruvate carboxylase